MKSIAEREAREKRETRETREIRAIMEKRNNTDKLGKWGTSGLALIAKTLFSATMILLITALPVLAGPEGSGINPGVRIGQWIQYNVAALFAPLIGLIALYYLLRRQFTKFLAFACFAVLVALFIYAGNDFKDAAVTFGRWVIGR